MNFYCIFIKLWKWLLNWAINIWQELRSSKHVNLEMKSHLSIPKSFRRNALKTNFLTKGYFYCFIIRLLDIKCIKTETRGFSQNFSFSPYLLCIFIRRHNENVILLLNKVQTEKHCLLVFIRMQFLLCTCTLSCSLLIFHHHECTLYSKHC